MSKRILTMIAALALMLGISTGFAQSASAAVPAGNGTSNFYLTGHCGINLGLGSWAALDLTNYDSGANQVYHTSVTRSGVGIVVNGVYVDGVWKTSNLESYLTVAGHGSHIIWLKVHLFLDGSKIYYCGITK